MAEKKSGFVKWFSELSNKDVPIAGGKGASLAEMYNIGMPVPPGFVITAQTYAYFLKKTGLDEQISHILAHLNVEDTAALNKASKEIREIIERAKLPEEIGEEVIEAYEILGSEKKDSKSDALKLLESSEETFVAVRSSATTEDLADASFAGQQESFLSVKGKTDLLEKVKKCMSSLFTPRAIYYRQQKGFGGTKAYLAVVVQKMINSTKSGVIFSQNPTTKEDDIVIEAVWGLGEGIVSGMIKPDHYVISEDLEDFKILESTPANKKIAIIRNERGKNEIINLPEHRKKQQVLDTYELKMLSNYAKKLEQHYKKPQDIEFAIEGKEIYIVQSRPITTKFKESTETVEGKSILSGLGASPGIASGTVRIIHRLSELEKVHKGDVLVTEMTNPDMVVAMQKSAAIVTDEGGVTSHAAIVSREMGIPAVVGTEEATKILKDGDIITVDGNVGKVYPGKGETKLIEILPVVPTRIKIKVIADLPEGAERAVKTGVKAIGLVRLEGLIAIGGKHPLKFVKDKKMNEYTSMLAEGIKKITKHYEEVWIRTSDLRSDEFSNLEGAPQQVEGNPMLGDHGIRFSLKHKDIMKAEITAIKHALDHYPNKKIGIMVPQVISSSEVQETKTIAEQIGMPPNFKVGIMVETPAAVQVIEDICKLGIDFISFGTNDLTQYTLAIDRNNPEVQHLFDETHPAIVNSIKQVIRICKKYGVETSICGQAGSKENMVKILLAEGIDSISVNADAAHKISILIAELEKSQKPSHEEKEHEHHHEKTEPEHHVTFIEKVKEIIPIEKHEHPEHHPTPRVFYTHNKEIEEEKDIEEIILQELDNNYQASIPTNEKTEDIPSLNDSIPIDSDSFTSESTPQEITPTEAETTELSQEKEVEFHELSDKGEWNGENH